MRMKGGEKVERERGRILHLVRMHPRRMDGRPGHDGAGPGDVGHPVVPHAPAVGPAPEVEPYGRAGGDVEAGP